MWMVAFGVLWCLKHMVRVINKKGLCVGERWIQSQWCWWASLWFIKTEWLTLLPQAMAQDQGSESSSWMSGSHLESRFSHQGCVNDLHV